MSAVVQNTPEWLEYRKNKIGASDAPIIMKVSPWKTPYELWEEKIGLKTSDEQNFAQKRGNSLEEKARTCFEEKTGIIMFPSVIVHPDHPWMMASLDGMDIEQHHIVEIKCPNAEDHKLAKRGEIPEKYYPQLQHQLEVSGIDMAYYFSFDGEDGVIVEVGRNTKYIREMVDEEEKFYKCMKDAMPPQLMQRDFQFKDDEMWTHTAQEWKKVYNELISLEKKEKELKESLIGLCRGKNSLGGGVRISKIVRKGNIKYGEIPELKGKNLEQYRGPMSEYWRISEDGE